MTSHITIVGNLVRPPELRFTPSGAAVCKFGVAVNRRWQNKQTSEWEEDTSFFDVVTWKDLAEHVAASLGKGDRVVVTGRLDQRAWDDKDSGQKRYAVEIVADEVGPSLRWATAKVAKTEKTGGGGAAPSRKSQDDYDDEPFHHAPSHACPWGTDLP